jgi:phosphoribosylamine--glycine ligase
MSKGKIYFCTRFGDGIGLVPTFQSEGYEVITHIGDPFFRGIYDGFIKKIPDIDTFSNLITTDDLVVFDSCGFGDLGDKLRARKVSVYGGQVIADKLENDRMFGLRVMAECGVKVPYTVHFKTHKEGLDFVKKNPNTYVYKPFGSGSASAKTFVSHDDKEMMSFLQSQKKDVDYILQIKVEGKEYSTEMFFSQGNPVEPSFHTIEDKKAYAGEEGPNTGCMDTVQIADKNLNGKMIKNGLGKCFEYMKKIKYTGNIDLNSIVDKHGNLWGIEWTCRDGWSSSYARNEMVKGKTSELYWKIARGEISKVDLLPDTFGLSLRIGIPPYPEESNKENEKYFNPQVRLSAGKKIIVKPHKGITYNFLDVKDGGVNLVTAGCDGIICELSTNDTSIVNGKKRILEARKDFNVENSWIRSDFFERALKEIPELIDMGIYDGPEFKGEKYVQDN